MIHGDESDEEADSPAFVRRMLAQMVPDPERVIDVVPRLHPPLAHRGGGCPAGALDDRGRRRT